MKKLLIVLSSVRKNRLSDKVKDLVEAELKDYPDFETTVADFNEMPLAFFDSPLTPSDESYAPESENVKKWIGMVDQADAVLILSAEYNHSYTAVLKNAVDWVPGSVWEAKPVGFVGYGWTGSSRAIEKTRVLLTEYLKANPSEAEGSLRFLQEIQVDGTVIDTEGTSQTIRAALDSLK